MRGGGDSAAPAVVPPKLSIIPPNSDTAIATNGDGLLNENADATDAAHTANKNRIEIGRITDDKDPNGDAIYALTKNAPTTDNADFRIENNILYYVGDDAGDFEANPRAQYNIKIERYKNQEDATAESNSQTFDFIVNIKDLANSLTIALPNGDPIASGDEAGFLPENLDGSPSAGGRKLVGTITNASGTYRLINHDDRFEIDGNQIFYIGTALDFEDPNAPKSFALNIEHTDSNNNKQTFEYIANLKDIAPDITGYEADGTTEIDTYTMAAIVGEATSGSNIGNSIFEIIFGAVAEGQTFTIDFVTGDEGFLIKTEPQYVDPENPSSETLTGFIITTGRQSSFTVIVNSLNSGDVPFDPSEEAQADFAIWQSFLPSIKHLVDNPGLAPGDGGTDLYSNSWTLTGRATIGVNENTTGTIADFNSPDGSYSLSGADAGLFVIDANGALRFAAAPTFDAGSTLNNYHEVTVEVSDGTNSDTYNLLVVVQKAASPSSTASDAAPTAAEAVPDTDDPATPEAEAAKPSIGRRILDYLFGSQEEHRQMQNQQMDNMFGDSDLDPINPQDPDML